MGLFCSPVLQQAMEMSLAGSLAHPWVLEVAVARREQAGCHRVAALPVASLCQAPGAPLAKCLP